MKLKVGISVRHFSLINSVKGKMEEGLIFCGSNVDRIKEIVSVHDLMQELVT